MKELTRERAIELHREMWHRIADTCERSHIIPWKYDTIRDMGIDPETVLWHCFLCHFAYERAYRVMEERCRRCPLVWPGGVCYWEACLHSTWMRRTRRTGRLRLE